MTAEAMPKPYIGVHRRGDSTNWQWQIKAPKDLLSLYSSVWAHRCSLKTADLRKANLKAAQLHAEWLTRFEQQRQQLSPQKVERVTPAIGRLAAQKTLHDLLDEEQVRIDFPLRKDAIRYHQRLGVVGMKIAAESLGVVFDEDTPGVREAALHYVHALEDSRQAKIIEQPPAPTLKAAEEAKPRFLRDVFERWKASKMPRKDSLASTERALKLFEQHTGNPPLAKITRDQGDAFRAWLLEQAGARKTKRDKLTAVKSLLNYARRELEWISRQPWEGLDIEYRTENKRIPWTVAQVKAFFGLALFTNYELPKLKHAAGAAAYWIPLLGLYTGARLGELCQLRVADVLTRDGQAFISINDDGDGSTVKTAASVRDVPLHSELLRLGFLEYVEATKKAGSTQLWPAMKFREGKPSHFFSAWFRKARKLVPEGVPDFHSLRHTVRTKMTEARIAELVQDRITGHEVSGSVGTKVYAHLSTEMLREAVEAVQYPGLSLPKVYRPQAQG